MPNRVFIRESVWAWLQEHPEVTTGSFARLLDAPDETDRQLSMYAPPTYEATISVGQTSKIIVEYTIRLEWTSRPIVTVTRIRGPFPS